MRHALLVLVPLAGCLFTQPDPPLLQVTSPKRSLIVEDTSGMVTVTGVALPNASGAAIKRVVVNGTPAQVDATGAFTATIRVPLGGSLIQTVATDADGGEATDTRSIVAGERRTSGSSVPRAIGVQLAPNMFAHIARIATQELKQADLGALVAQANPIVDKSATGCLAAKAYVDSVKISDAAVTLAPTTGGLQIVATLQQPVITGRVQYAAACTGGTRNFTMRADRATVRGKLVFDRGANGLTPRLDGPAFETPGLQITTSGGIPDAVLGILPMETIIQAVTPTATRRFVDPMLRDALADLQQPHQLNVLGKSVTFAAVPSLVEFSPTGGRAMLDLRFAMAGGEASRGFTYTPNGVPQLDARDGIGLGVADDLVNDALAQLAASGVLDLTLPFDGGDFDTVKLSPSLPPMINADGVDGRLKLLLPDVSATFLRGGRAVASASVNAQIAIAVRPAGDGGSVKIDLGEASIAIDSPDENARSSSFAAAVDFGAGDQQSSIQLVIDAIPLPKLGELTLSDVSITSDNGYVKAMGTVQ